jgi:competence protein ComEA
MPAGMPSKRLQPNLRPFVWIVKSFVTGIFPIVLTLPAHQDKASSDKGKVLTERICVSCHDLETVTATRRTEIGWASNVDQMASRGADGTPDEFAEVVRYLSKNFGKLNVNTATARQLQEFLSLTEQDAQAIRTWRERNGEFKDLEQLKAVPKIDAAKLQEKRELIAFSL